MRITLQVLAVAIGALAVTGQNPLAPNADLFSGSFQNEQMKLELSRTGQEYSGVIILGGQSLPVKAKADAGKLTGAFDSGGQSYTFQVTRAGSQLTLVTDGVTHVLEKATGAAPAKAPAVVGDWQGQTGIVRINADGTATIGDKPHRWSIEGNTITLTGNGESIKVPFEMAGNNWTWKFPGGQLVLTRAGTVDRGIAGSWQGPTGNVQMNLDGSATVGGVIYRYTQTADQLTLAGPDGTFIATVKLAGDNMTWVVNGKTLTFQRAATTWAVGGGTAAGGILPELVGKWCQATNLNNTTGSYARSACFTLLADGSFQFASEFGATGQVPAGTYGAASDGNDSGTWTATANTITSTSKKTGVRSFRLEKRNHPKTGDPMLLLDGEAYTTAYQKTPWR